MVNFPRIRNLCFYETAQSAPVPFAAGEEDGSALSFRPAERLQQCGAVTGRRQTFVARRRGERIRAGLRQRTRAVVDLQRRARGNEKKTIGLRRGAKATYAAIV